MIKNDAKEQSDLILYLDRVELDRYKRAEAIQ